MVRLTPYVRGAHLTDAPQAAPPEDLDDDEDLEHVWGMVDRSYAALLRSADVATPPTKLVLRLGQIGDQTPPPIAGGTGLVRLVGGGMTICTRHLSELAPFRSKLEARVVLTTDQIDSLVAEFGLRRGDLMANHGPWDPIFGVERCRMCETPPVQGNLCHADDCRRPLHPQWPIVYCSDECAWGDARG